MRDDSHIEEQGYREFIEVELQKSSSQDRTDLPFDYRFLELLLDASGDREVGLGLFARGVRVGPGSRLLRLPARYAQKKTMATP